MWVSVQPQPLQAHILKRLQRLERGLHLVDQPDQPRRSAKVAHLGTCVWPDAGQNQPAEIMAAPSRAARWIISIVEPARCALFDLARGQLVKAGHFGVIAEGDPDSSTQAGGRASMAGSSAC